MIHLKRNGYGSSFNDIYYDSEKLVKKVKNEYGLSKMKNEIAFYNYIKESNCIFPAPILYSSTETELCMKYYSKYVPLYKIFTPLTPSKKIQIKEKIMNHLHTLHCSSTKHVLKGQYMNDIHIETHVKIMDRLKDVKPIIDSYTIKKVNNITLCSFEDLFSFIKAKIQEYISLKEKYTYVPIHGDCQFNNILYDIETDDMVFIDPRGYFGSSSIFGIPEYDIAKVVFALTGYDIFDNMQIDTLDIDGDNLNMKNIFLEENPLEEESLTKYLVLSIWLGNAHCFKDTPLKAVYSYYYALYLGTLVYNDAILGTK